MVRSHKQREQREGERVRSEKDCRRFRVQIVVQLSQSTYFLRCDQQQFQRSVGVTWARVGVAVVGRRWQMTQQYQQQQQRWVS